MDKFRESALQRLAAFLPRALSDGSLDPTERQELIGILTSGVLTKDDVQGVFKGFLKTLHREVTADGVITTLERERCLAVVRELRIPDAFLPPEWQAIQQGD